MMMASRETKIKLVPGVLASLLGNFPIDNPDAALRRVARKFYVWLKKEAAPCGLLPEAFACGLLLGSRMWP